MKNKIRALMPFIIYIVIVAAVILISKWIFEAVYYSDMPDWLKYVLLH